MIELCHCEQSDFVRKRRGRPKMKREAKKNSSSSTKLSNSKSISYSCRNENTNIKITPFEEAYNYINNGERFSKNKNLTGIKNFKRKRKKNPRVIIKKSVVLKTNNNNKKKQKISNKRPAKCEENESKKVVKKSSNLFDIDNFIIHSNNSAKFFETEKKINVNIPVPKFSLLTNKFFKSQGNHPSDEDVCDDSYLKLHEIEEEKEKEERENFFKKKNKNKPSRNDGGINQSNGLKKNTK